MYNKNQDVAQTISLSGHFTKKGEAFRMKKWLGILFAMVLLVGLLVACGPDDAKPENSGNDNNGTEEANGNNENTSDEEAETEMPEKPEVLKLWVNAEEKQEDAVTEITAKYTEETGIEIELVPVDI